MSHEFDPLSDLFVAQFAKPPDLGIVNLRALTPFQRALLVIDGTVTKFIEAYTMEPVTVRIISHEQRRLSAENAWLEAEGGARRLGQGRCSRGEVLRCAPRARALASAARASTGGGADTDGRPSGRLGPDPAGVADRNAPGRALVRSGGCGRPGPGEPDPEVGRVPQPHLSDQNAP